jgi:hypothetical protein
MQFSPKWLVSFGTFLFFLGLGLYLRQSPEMSAPPKSLSVATPVKAPEATIFPSVEYLSGPWFRRPKVVPLQRTKVMPVAAKSPATAQPIDRTSMVFVGSYKDTSVKETYFFKYLPTGQIIVLRLGETIKGWTLQAVNDAAFSLAANGGLYAVAR